MRKIDETDEGRIERRERDQGAEKVKKRERERSTKSATGTPERDCLQGDGNFSHCTPGWQRQQQVWQDGTKDG